MTDEQTLEKEILTEIILCTQYGWKQHPEFKFVDSCAICLDELHGKYVLETLCGHCFDYNCIMTTLIDYFIYDCPTCSKYYIKKN